MSKSTLKILPALIIAITAAAFVTQSVSGQVPTPTPVITFTERSSTNLTAVYTDGFGTTTNLTVTPGSSPDSWSVDVLAAGPDVMNTNRTLTVWFEPSSTSFFNLVDGITNVDAFGITSDSTLSFTPPFATANGTMSTFPIATAFHSNNTTSLVFGVFNDLGDVATTPDTGTTASLFGLSLMGLAFLRRKIPA